MSRPNALALLPLAESIADGAPIDWEAVEADATEAERVLIRQLRVLSNLAGLHRSLPAATPDVVHETPERKPLASPAIGSWAHLALLERLGGGTFGDVYRAWDRHLEREVALKLLRADEAIDDLHASRIAREGRLLARVRHSNVITVHGVDAHDGRVGLWMELVRGVTLEEQIATRGPLSAREAAAVGIDLCRALSAIHGAGLIHRDVKAQNVMREDGGRIVLMDLGTGREMDAAAGEQSASDLAGTPLYLAPEIFAGAPASERTDLYSLGVLLYHLVTGSFPVQAATIEDLQNRHARRRMVRLRDARADLPSGFVRVIDRAIDRHAKRRYASAGEFEADLVQALGDPVSITIVNRDRHESTPRVTRPRAVALIAALAAAIVMAAIAWPKWRTPPGAGISAGTIRSIAVLPLANLSGDPSQEYFADGMTDELIGTLGNLGGVRVISRTSAMVFKGSKTPLPEIARALKVDAVLEGSVLVVPGHRGAAADDEKTRVRINARLIYAGTDTQLWDRTFENVVADVFGLQNDVARAVADGIHARLASTTSARMGQDFAAFDLYLKGRYNWNLRTNEGLNESIRLFQQALVRDPRSAVAYAGLADAYAVQAAYGWVPFADGISRAQRAALKAIELDETLGEAHASLGLVHDDRLEWEAADASYKRALDLNPGYALAHHWYAEHLAARGYFDDALAEIRKAEVLDPLSAPVQGELGIILFLSRRFDEAIVQSQRTLQMNGRLVRQHALMAEAYAQQGKFDLALAAADRATALDPESAEIRTYPARILALAGRRADALRLASEVAERFRTVRDVHAVDVAAIYASLSDNDRAFEWLERARQSRDPWISYIKVDPWFDKLRSDRRFDSLLATLGLPQ